ncbi:uncharacterized protein M6B38_298795 [Iris pallida]|uniref:SnoaL-like domain-containing protein n=1 Tax=Iris pallida TaxID=29817 RepID=A0AAX6HP98_IRIPA|nr:uncharacterized protein M6B38_298795 [Iris pallida]
MSSICSDFAYPFLSAFFEREVMRSSTSFPLSSNPTLTSRSPKTLETRVSLRTSSSIGAPRLPSRRARHGSVRLPRNSSVGVGANRSQVTEADQLQASSTSSTTSGDVVREFYDRINRRDLAGVEDLIGEDCVYEDLIFSQPFVGRKAILEFFKKFTESISGDLQFVIDDICDDDTLAVGVTWHLEWQGRTFPFSRGCSFYRLEVLDGRRQIIYGRDSVEPATKPGETALVLIRAVTWILQRFPQLADRL